LTLQRCEYLQLPLKALKLVLQAGHFQLQLPLYSPQLTHLLLSLSLLTCNLLNLATQLLCLHTQQTATYLFSTQQQIEVQWQKLNIHRPAAHLHGSGLPEKPAGSYMSTRLPCDFLNWEEIWLVADTHMRAAKKR